MLAWNSIPFAPFTLRNVLLRGKKNQLSWHMPGSRCNTAKTEPVFMWMSSCNGHVLPDLSFYTWQLDCLICSQYIYGQWLRGNREINKRLRIKPLISDTFPIWRKSALTSFFISAPGQLHLKSWLINTGQWRHSWIDNNFLCSPG